MTPDEAAAVLGVEKDASTTDILSAYSREAKAAGAGTPEQLQAVIEARATLMSYRQTQTASAQRVAVSQGKDSGSGTAQPLYGVRAPSAGPATTESGWPDDAKPGKRTLTAAQVDSRKKASLTIAVIALIFSIFAWVRDPFFVPGVLGVVLAIWALVRVRGWGGGLYTATKIVAWVSIVAGIVALVGSGLYVYGPH